MFARCEGDTNTIHSVCRSSVYVGSILRYDENLVKYVKCVKYVKYVKYVKWARLY